ncbi:hypothetical protein ACFLUW_00405 [Chloroflexota bacterium]
MHKNQPIRSPWLYILPMGRKDYADSVVVGLTGPKRSGKSLELAKLLFWGLCAGKKVWSNMPVQTPKFYLDKGFPMLKTMPIDWDAFYTMSEEYQDGLMGIDEAAGVNSNRGSLSSRNRVSNAFYNQVGHRNIDLAWTAKSSGWLDRQGLGFETDIEVVCQDMAKTTWGRKRHLKKGTNIRLEAWDRSGALTGKSADIRDRWARPFKCWIDNTAWHYWDAYSTKALQSLEELFGGVKLDLTRRIISNKARVDDEMLQSVKDLATQLTANSDNLLVDCAKFRAAADISGMRVSDKVLGQSLKQLGVEHVQRRGGNCYDLTGLFEK